MASHDSPQHSSTGSLMKIASYDANNNLLNLPGFYNFIGLLISETNLLLISETKVVVGSAASQTGVDFPVAKHKLISNEHFIIYYSNYEFWIVCRSKYGLYIDGTFLSKASIPRKLPKSCCFQFAGTDVRVCFDNLIGRIPTIGLLVNCHMLPSFVSDMLGRSYEDVFTEKDVRDSCDSAEKNGQKRKT